jgi:hypothetical protein
MSSRLFPHKPEKQGPFPPARCLARLRRYCEPVGLPSGTHDFSRPVLCTRSLPDAGSQVRSLLFRILFPSVPQPSNPGEVQQVFWNGLLSVAFAVT